MSERTVSPALGSFRLLTATLYVTALLALVCNLVLELVQSGGDLSLLWHHTLGEARPLFVIGTLVVWLAVLLVLAVTGRLWLTVGLMLAVTLVVAYANHEKLRLRTEPLYPSDLAMGKEVGFLGQMVGVGSLVLLVVAVAVVVTGFVLLGRLLARRFPRIRFSEHPRLAPALLAARVLGVVLCLSLFAYLGQFNAPGNEVRGLYESHGAHWKWWYQPANYLTNGFVGGVLYNLGGPAMTEPADYDEATMQAISARYARAAALTNATRSATAIDRFNVVLVLSEAFTDPTQLSGVRYAQDPIPFTRALSARTTSGTMLAQLFGGGTANMEFEALTGQSLALFQPQMNAPYQQLLPDYTDYPSAVGYLRARGHRAVAVHPFLTSMYQRGTVYPVLGFEEFVSQDTVQSRERLEDNPFISDRATFAEVGYQIERSRRPLLLNVVTMQNHFPFVDLYSDPIPAQGTDPGDETEEAGQYGRGLRYSDQALAGLLRTLRASPEPTVVVFYGDHLPAFWSPRTRAQNTPRTLKQTRFLLWSNRPGPPPRALPTTSPIFFMPHVFTQVDAAVPPFYALLMQLEQEIPALEHGMWVDGAGSRLRPGSLSPRARRLLHDYRLVQYDLSVGEHYSQDTMFYRPRASGAGQ